MGFSNIYDSITGNDQITKPNKKMDEKKKKNTQYDMSNIKNLNKKIPGLYAPHVWLHRTLYELSAKLNIYEHQLKK